MTRLAEIEHTLGSASALVVAPVSDTENATIGRWRHGDAEPRMTSGDGLIKIVVNLSNTQKVERLRHGVWTSKSFDICSFSLVPPDEDFSFSVRGPADVLQVLLPENVAAFEERGPGVQTIRPRFQEHDPRIERYALQLMKAAHDGCSGEDIRLAELIAGLGDFLAHDCQKQSSPVKGGLSPYRLRRVLDLIASAVNAPSVQALRLDQLAIVAELSSFHFARAFRDSVGLSPYSYVLRKRLERARAMLARSTWSVASVARQTGFKSHAHFSSQFRQQMGVSPVSFRRAIRHDQDIGRG